MKNSYTLLQIKNYNITYSFTYIEIRQDYFLVILNNT